MILTDTIHTALLHKTPISYSIVRPDSYEKVCLWLHGFGEHGEDIRNASDLEFFAEKYKIAIILPDVPDTYYLDQSWNDCYTEQFLLFELIPAIKTKYNVLSDKKDLCIAGISMGGFGSLLLGSHFCDLFSKIVCISGAFIIPDILIGNPEIIGTFSNNLEYFQNIFGDIPSLENSYSRNPEVAACQALKIKQLPPVFMTCGTEDMLFTRNVKLRNRLLDSGADVTWKEAGGNHDWKFFNMVLEDVFRWMAL